MWAIFLNKSSLRVAGSHSGLLLHWAHFDMPRIVIYLTSRYVGQVLLRAQVKKVDVIEAPFGTELRIS